MFCKPFGWLFAVTLLVSPISVKEAVAAGPGPITTGRVDLKDRLERDLRARRPQEFAFIARVVKMVEEGTLPRNLVEATYLWARKKRANAFQFFERGLRTRARRLGIRI